MTEAGKTKDVKAKRIEFRTPNPTCNGYLAFAAMLMAGLDGIERRVHTAGEDKSMLDPFRPEREEDVERLNDNTKELRYRLEDEREAYQKLQEDHYASG